MDLNTVIKRLPMWYESGRCVYLRSGPGVGKTTVMSDAPGILSKLLNKKMGLVVINGSLLNPPDSIGYLIPQYMQDGSAPRSIYTLPFWFVTKEGKLLTEYDGGIIIVDDVSQADVDVKKALGEAALTGRLGPHEIPKGWVLWMTGNRVGDRSGSTKELDNLINRRFEVEVEPHFPSFRDYAERNNVLPITIAFAENNQHIVFADTVPEVQGPWCTPRSTVEWDRYLQLAGKYNNNVLPDDPIIIEECAGQIGIAAASQYFNTLRLDREMPKFETIVASPRSVKVPERPDACMLVCYNLAYQVKPETIEPVLVYVERMPKEFAVSFANSAVKRKPLLTQVPAFRKWVQQNSSLLAVIAVG